MRLGRAVPVFRHAVTFSILQFKKSYFVLFCQTILKNTRNNKQVGAINSSGSVNINKNLAIANRSQYVEGIYWPNNPVTLKSRLRVTQGHCKRNHWTDHTRVLVVIELFDGEYYRDLEIWLRGHSGSLKLVPFKSSVTVSYSPSRPIVTVAVSVAVCELFSVNEWCDFENRVRVRSRSLKMAAFDRSHMSSY